MPIRPWSPSSTRISSAGSPTFARWARRRMPSVLCCVSWSTRWRSGCCGRRRTSTPTSSSEKATSNICTNVALMALASAVYLSVMGRQGLRRVAELCYHKAHYAAAASGRVPGFHIWNEGDFFHEFVVGCPRPVADINKHLLQHHIIGGYEL